MTISERHEEINKIFKNLKAAHEKYFPPGRKLTDKEWDDFIKESWSVAEQYKGTNLQDFAGRLTMLFSDDIEMVDKAWRGKE